MYISRTVVRALTQNSCWVFPPTSRKDYLIQNKLLGPRSCLYHLELSPATRKITTNPLFQSQEQPNLNACASWDQNIQNRRFHYKSNTTYPVLSWKVHLHFLTCFFASVNRPEILIIVYSRRCSSGLRKRVKRLDVSPQVSSPKDKSLRFQLSYHFLIPQY